MSEQTVSNLRILKRNGLKLIKQAYLLVVANLAKYWLEILTLQIVLVQNNSRLAQMELASGSWHGGEFPLSGKLLRILRVSRLTASLAQSWHRRPRSRIS